MRENERIKDLDKFHLISEKGRKKMDCV